MKNVTPIKLEPYVEELLGNRYYVPNENWTGLCDRVSGALFGEKGMEKLRREAFDTYHDRRAIMASPTLMNAGTRLRMLSSCFIYPIHDSLKSIFATLDLTADTFKKGGGVGIDFSPLRPAGAVVNKTGGVSTGPVSFMGNYDHAGKSVSGGGLRKAAQLGALRAEHPNIDGFIKAKSDAQRSGDGTHLSSMNLSVGVPDNLYALAAMEEKHPDEWFSCINDASEIVPNGWHRLVSGDVELPENAPAQLREQYGERAVRQGKDGLWHLHWGGSIYEDTSAQKLLRTIAEEAWEAGCPGVIFIDQVNRRGNFVPNVGYIRNPNPCGEFMAPVPGDYIYDDHSTGLPPFDHGGPTCNLGSINLDAHIRKVDNGEPWAWEMEYEKLERTTRLMTRALDRVVDVNRLPTLESMLLTQLIRPIGLGVFGLANILIRLGLRYDSEEGRDMAADLLERITYWSMDESVNLAVESRKRGDTVGRFDSEKLKGLWSEECKRKVSKPKKDVYPRSDDSSFAAMDRQNAISGGAGLWNSFRSFIEEEEGEACLWTPENAFTPWKSDDPLRGSFPAIHGSRWDFSSLELDDLKNETVSKQHLVDRLRKGGFLFAAGVVEHGHLSMESWLNLFRRIKRDGIRHCHTTFLMPTGTTSFICNCTETSGMEPIYSLLRFKRKHAETTSSGGTVYVQRYYYPQVVLDYAEQVLKLDRNKILDGEIEVSLKSLPTFFRSALDVSPRDHVLMQATCQRFVHNGISKCVAKGTVLATNRGIVPIESLATYSQEDSFVPVDDYQVRDAQGELKKVQSLYYGGMKPIRRIRFTNGYVVRCAETHSFLSPRGVWIAARDLRVGDYLVQRLDLMDFDQKPSLPAMVVEKKTNAKTNVQFDGVINDASAKWFGMWLADGSVSCNSVTFTEKNENVGLLYDELSEAVWGVRPKVSVDKRNGVRNHTFNSRFAVRYLKANFGFNSRTKYIPQPFLLASRSVRQSLLEGLSLDGYLSQGRTCLYDGRSKDIANKVIVLLSSLGLRYWRGQKVDRMGTSYSASAYMRDRSFNFPEDHKNNYVVCDYRQRSYAIPTEEESLRLNEPRSCSDERYVDSYNARKMISDHGFVNYGLLEGALGVSRPAVESTIVAIAAIEDDGVDEVFDIEVADSHSYTVGGMVCHNTVNLPESATVEDVLYVYRLAHEEGCFGVTIYRHHSKTEQIYDLMEDEAGKTRRVLPKPPSKLPLNDQEGAEIFRIRDQAIGGGKVFATMALLDDRWPIELFLNFNSGLPEDSLEVVKSRNLNARLISNLLRRGVSAEEIIRNLEKCSRGRDFHSQLANCFREVLAKAHRDDPNEVLPERTLNTIRPRCESPGCSGRYVMEGGCYKCPECGMSKCG